MAGIPGGLFWLLAVLVLVVVASELAGLRYIANNRVGIVEKLWSVKGSVPEGRIIALEGEAGIQAEVLRGGLHFRLWRWQYRIHKMPLVSVPLGKIGYIYARDGEALMPSQTLGQVIACNNFQDARTFLGGESTSPDHEPILGQRGRQRAILREGVYAINVGLFTVITEEVVYRLEAVGSKELKVLVSWQNELSEHDGFNPVIIGGAVESPDPLNPERKLLVDSMGIVTVHDGPSLPPGEIIAPAVGVDRNNKDFHNNFQDPEAFLRAGGRRGLQYVPLTDGTYFINRWFATIESIAKTIVPIGYVGVVVSYYGRSGQDLSGQGFRHGERVADGERGVQEKPLGPGKYAFNTYAGNIILVPTTNFVLHWVTGRTEAHRYDESLRSIDLVTKDAYEPTLPLSVVVHIDYQKAPSVIQRFGDVKKLITQTLDPMFERLLPRRGAQAHHAGVAPGSRLDPKRVEQRTWSEVSQFRHRVRRRLDRQARHATGRGQDRDTAGTAPTPATVARASRDVLETGHSGPEPASAERSPSTGTDANAALKLAGAGSKSRRTKLTRNWPGLASRPSR